MRILLRLVLLTALFCGSVLETAWAKPYQIYMILWRGETEVEAGLRDYFRNHQMDVTLTVRSAKQDAKNIPSLVREAREMRPDLVYTWGTPVTLGVVGTYDGVDPARHITDIPVVFSMVTSPEGSRIIKDRKHPSRNVTGVSHVVPIETQIKALLSYRQARRIGVIYNPMESNSAMSVRALRGLSARYGFDLVEAPVPLDANNLPIGGSVPDLVAQVAAREPQFLYIGSDSFIGAHRKLLTSEAEAHGLPTFTATEVELRDATALAGLVSRYDSVGRLAARKIRQILVEGMTPAQIPVETLHRFSYIVRMDVAKRLSFYPPMKILEYAEIIQ